MTDHCLLKKPALLVLYFQLYGQKANRKNNTSNFQCLFELLDKNSNFLRRMSLGLLLQEQIHMVAFKFL